jgi:hypothetical protein
VEKCFFGYVPMQFAKAGSAATLSQQEIKNLADV